MTTPLTAGERLTQLEQRVQALTEQVNSHETFILDLFSSTTTLLTLMRLLPDILNQNMQAVRAAEVRKFKNHLDFASEQQIKSLNKLESKEN